MEHTKSLLIILLKKRAKLKFLCLPEKPSPKTIITLGSYMLRKPTFTRHLRT